MKIHRNARLGLAGRHELVKAIEAEGQRAAARSLGVSPATANKWWWRRRDARSHPAGRASPWSCAGASTRKVKAIPASSRGPRTST